MSIVPLLDPGVVPGRPLACESRRRVGRRRAGGLPTARARPVKNEPAAASPVYSTGSRSLVGNLRPHRAFPPPGRFRRGFRRRRGPLAVATQYVAYPRREGTLRLGPNCGL